MAVDIVLAILLLFGPLVYGWNLPQDWIDVAFFRLGSISLFAAYAVSAKKEHTVPDSVRYGIGTAIGAALVPVFISTFSPPVMSGFLNLFFACLCVFIISRGKFEFKWISRIMVVAACINILVFVGQMQGFSPWMRRADVVTYDGQGGAFLVTLPRLGTYLALLVPCFMTVNMFLGTVLLLLFGIYTKQLAILAMVLVYFFVRSNRLFKGFTLAGLAVTVYAFFDKIMQSLTLRWTMCWKPALEYIAQRPLLGYGLGINPMREVTETAANDYLHIFIWFGVIGIILLAVLWRLAFYKIQRGNAYASIVGLLTLMLFEDPLVIVKLWFPIISMIAVYFITQRNIKEVTE